MRDTFGPSSTPCSLLLKHARHTSKEPEGTREASLSCGWGTKRKRALFPLVIEKGSERTHQGLSSSVPRPRCTGYLGHPFKKQALRDGERTSFPACKHGRVGVQSEVVNS